MVDILKLIREANNLTKEEVAEVFGITVNDITEIENNIADISVQSLLAISDYYKIPASKILGYYEEMFYNKVSLETIKRSVELYYSEIEAPDFLEKKVARIKS